MGRVSNWARRAEASLPEQRPPTMRLHLGPAVAAWVLRLAALLLAVSASVVVANSVVTMVLMILASLTVAFWPGYGLPVGVAAFLGWGLMVGEPTVAESTVVVFCVHGFLVLSRVVGGVSWEAVVELRVLARVGWPFLVLQVIAQTFMHLALALPQGGDSVVWIAVVVLAVLVGLTAVMVRALRSMT